MSLERIRSPVKEGFAEFLEDSKLVLALPTLIGECFRGHVTDYLTERKMRSEQHSTAQKIYFWTTNLSMCSLLGSTIGHSYSSDMGFVQPLFITLAATNFASLCSEMEILGSRSNKDP